VPLLPRRFSSSSRSRLFLLHLASSASFRSLYALAHALFSAHRSVSSRTGGGEARTSLIVSFVAFHEHGLGLPVDRFMQALPHYYGVELHNFNPNSIAQAAIFIAVCEGYLGIAPH